MDKDASREIVKLGRPAYDSDIYSTNGNISFWDEKHWTLGEACRWRSLVNCPCHSDDSSCHALYWRTADGKDTRRQR
jgi:hypothetical protein